MKKYIYAAIMVLYIGLSIITINFASNWMMEKNYAVIASKAKDIAILTAKNFTLTNAEVEELKKLEFKDIISHPANIRLEDMFNNKYGYEDIRFVYIMTELDKEHLKYHVTKEYEDFFDAPVGTPLNVLYLVDVVVGKTTEETLNEDKAYYDDVRRYSYLRESDLIAFKNRVPTHAITNSEFGFTIYSLAPIYTEEGAFVGMLGVDIYIDEYKNTTRLIRLLLLVVFLLPSVILTGVYIMLYIINVREALLSAQTDPLTSVKNRRFMEKCLSQAIKEHNEKKIPLSVIMIDIDFFKKFNDNYGHQEGDKVLIEVTKAITSVLRDKMDFLCRYGGEEFLVILPNTKANGAEVVAGRIKATVNNLAIKHEYSEVCDIVTVSQGVYSAVPLSTDSGRTFIEYADKGMYQAKSWGRNGYAFMETETRP
jgi:diguanylate cyclase (GGDEF)-like protein